MLRKLEKKRGEKGAFSRGGGGEVDIWVGHKKKNFKVRRGEKRTRAKKKTDLSLLGLVLSGGIVKKAMIGHREKGKKDIAYFPRVVIKLG